MTAPAAASVPFVALDRQRATIAGELEETFRRVLGASAFVLGEEVEEFEREFAAYCLTEHCVGVASGTAALTLAMAAAGIGPGDEVIVPAHTFIASGLAVVHAGATPVFCDVEAETGLIDPAAAEAAVGERTAAILAVHLYGQCCDMDALTDIAARRGLALFEDAAQAHGATWRGKRAGGFGTAAGFSFYPSKNLGALGDGGAICTDDHEIAVRARRLRHLGQLGKGDHLIAGYNERLDGLQAAFLRAKLPHLEEWSAARRDRAEEYDRALPADWAVLPTRPESRCVYHLYPIRVPHRDEIARRLARAGIATGVHYSPSLPAQPPFEGPHAANEFPHAAAWAAQELSLPMFECLTSEEIARVAGAVTVAQAA